MAAVAGAQRLLKLRDNPSGYYFVVPILLLAGIGLVLKRSVLRRLTPVFLFAVAYTAIHMILVGTIRYRLPLEPFLLIFASVAASRISMIWRPIPAKA